MGRHSRRTPARIGLGHVGGSLPTAAHLAFQLAHARARDAVHRALDVPGVLTDLERAGIGPFRFAARPRTGSSTCSAPIWDVGSVRETRAGLARFRGARISHPDVVFVVADGLSAAAPQRHAVPVLSLLIPHLKQDGWRIGPVIVAEQGRVALGDEVGELLARGWLPCSSGSGRG